VGSLRTAALLLSVGAVLAQPARAELVAPAPAATFATLTPSFSPNRLGAKAGLTITISYAGGEYNVPSPVLRSVVRLPAGLSLDIPRLRSCSIARLKAHGPSGCPPQSKIGTGHALTAVHAGSQTLTEDVTLWAFLGPFHLGQPTLEILAQGSTPLQRRVVLTGSVLAGEAPYGEELLLSVPSIPTLPLEPAASMVSFTLTIGASGRRRSKDANSVLVPSRCPAGGFPFSAEFTYADGLQGSAVATAACPR
jgi:hypothetical protein